jgi:hypothetical protein
VEEEGRKGTGMRHEKGWNEEGRKEKRGRG